MNTVLDPSKVFLTRTDWAGYQKIREALAHTRVRLTYFRGRLELMTPSPRHEMRKSTLSSLLEMFMLETGVDFQGGGSTTFDSEDLDQGLESDECYWIASFALVRGNEDEPALRPDLALEIEVSRKVLPRLPLLAALQVPEVWRYTRMGSLVVFVLTAEGYVERDRSDAFPDLALDELARHVALGREQGTSVALRSWQAWLRGV